MKTVISSILIMGGIVLMAGSAGDCDGKCMELANPMWLMGLIVFGSVASIGLGSIFLLMANKGGN